jgi:hypothetical protein
VKRTLRSIRLWAFLNRRGSAPISFAALARQAIVTPFCSNGVADEYAIVPVRNYQNVSARPAEYVT